MPRIAISYRRADSAAISGRLFDRLSQHYGSGSVFMDIDEIPFGIDFRTHIAEVLSTCDAVVVVIGQHWFGAAGGRRRIDEATDPVRIEVQTALDRKVPVIPVLVDDAVMPTVEDLPPPLQDLAFRNACEVATGRDFHAHVDRLIRSMDRFLLPADAPPRPAAHAPAGPPAPAGTVAGSDSPPRGALTWALLAFVVALPQLAQFSGRKEFYVAALCLSTIGTVHILDPTDRPLTHRLVFGSVLTMVVVFVQASIALLRASYE